jgi:hypothetical protein
MKARTKEQILSVWGRHETVVDLEKIDRSEKFVKRIMKGAVRVITPTCSTVRAYKYTKEVGTLTLTHNGKVWIVTGAGIAKCFAGRSIGGIVTTYLSQHRDEIVEICLHADGIAFTH